MSFLQATADALLSPILGPLLDIPPILAILIVSLFVSLISIIFQKYMTNQEKLKEHKARLKELQKQTKKHRSDQAKMMKLNQEMMALQGPMMKESFKPVIWTMIPFLLLFMWLSGHFAYLPLEPGVDFTVTAKVEGFEEMTLRATPGLTLDTPTVPVVDGVAVWTMSGDAAFYLLEFFGGSNMTAAPLASKSIVITNEREYEAPILKASGPIKMIEIGNPMLRPLGAFSILGWRPSWIWVYIVFSLIISMGLRKVMNVA